MSDASNQGARDHSQQPSSPDDAWQPSGDQAPDGMPDFLAPGGSDQLNQPAPNPPSHAVPQDYPGYSRQTGAPGYPQSQPGQGYNPNPQGYNPPSQGAHPQSPNQPGQYQPTSGQPASNQNTSYQNNQYQQQHFMPPQGSTNQGQQAHQQGNQQNHQQASSSRIGNRQICSSSQHWFNQPAPAQSYRRQRSSALVCTYSLIGLCFAVWVAQLFMPSVTDAFALSPFWGVLEPWRIFTSMFAHSTTNFTHIVMNMLTLWIIGQALEPQIGHKDFLTSYLISGLGGSTAFMAYSVLTDTNNWVFGSSGAVFGLFGVMITHSRRTRSSSSGIWVLVGLNLALGFIFPGIAWQAHVGGFVTGLGCGYIIAHNRQAPGRNHGWTGAQLLLLIPIAVLYLIAWMGIR